mmetsp:Transcript_104787/g.223965  ORF Transcript_104787/g.223965 Transcript_104787/m.223965 type:complete len:733 (-) Transcript_104787:99-2297(-)
MRRCPLTFCSLLVLPVHALREQSLEHAVEKATSTPEPLARFPGIEVRTVYPQYAEETKLGPLNCGHGGAFLRQHVVDLHLGFQDHSSVTAVNLQRGALVLTSERLLGFLDHWDDESTQSDAPFGSPVCRSFGSPYLRGKLPELSSYQCRYPCRSAALNIGTVDIVEELSGEDCLTLSGCFAADCKDGRRTWRACWSSDDTTPAGEESNVLKWRSAIDRAYLDANQIGQRLGTAIQRALEDIQEAQLREDPIREPPRSFSPLGPFSTLPAGDPLPANVSSLFNEIERSFMAGALPLFPGKNSRSGASFFTSANKKYMAKRIRPEERQALWEISRSGSYSRMLQFDPSVKPTLNPIFLCFLSDLNRNPWIISLTETLPADIEEHLPADARRFFEDIKPPPLTSDFDKLAQITLGTHRTLGLQFAAFDSWNLTLRKLNSDAESLEAHGLTDYSVLMQGATFPKNDTAISAIQQAIVAAPGCSVGCSTPPPPQFADVTHLLKDSKLMVHGKFGTSFYGKASFKCCCQDLNPGDSLAVGSPCVLVNIRKTPISMFKRSYGCGNHMRNGRWHHFRSLKHSVNGSGSLAITEQRCIVGLNIWPPTFDESAPLPDMIGPEAAFGIAPQGSPPAVCAVTCMSLLDYLLPLNFANRVENVALLFYYGQYKWSNYRNKMFDALRCLGEAQLPQRSGVWAPWSPRVQDVFKRHFPQLDRDVLRALTLFDMDRDVLRRITAHRMQ